MGNRKLKGKSKAGAPQKNKQKMEVGYQLRSSSSLSLSNVQAEMNNQKPSTSTTADKIADGKVGKKLKRGSKSASKNQIEVEIEDKCFIDELPPEMLVKVLKYLDVQSLAASRLVSRKWNGIAREIIQSRDDVETVFDCYTSNIYGDRIVRKSSRFSTAYLAIERKKPDSNLEDFNEWFEDSKESPLYTRFQFSNFTASVFECEEWLKFISYFGESIKSLRLEVDYCEEPDAMEWAEGLRHLLLNQVPNLQEFGLGVHRFYGSNRLGLHKKIHLFPTETTTTVQLPNLKVLFLVKELVSDPEKFDPEIIVTDLVAASVNLRKIEFIDSDDPDEGNTASFFFLESLGKLDCLQTAFIKVNAELLSAFKYDLSFPLGFKLKKLELDVESVYRDENIWSDASVFISHLFESSKDTLRELTMKPLGFLTALKLPKFSKLSNLAICKIWLKGIQVLPSGLDLNEIFPLLQNLELGVLGADFFGLEENPNVSCLSNVKTLKLTARGTTEEDIARISQVCPNLKELQISHLNCGGERDNFSEVATAIWTHLTQLQSLDLQIDLDSSDNSFPALDSCFTGFSGEYCIRLNNLIKAKDLLKKNGWEYQIEISESELEAERKNPSILHLKELKNLTVALWVRKDEPAFTRKILRVSEMYAFQLMENLTFKLEKNF